MVNPSPSVLSTKRTKSVCVPLGEKVEPDGLGAPTHRGDSGEPLWDADAVAALMRAHAAELDEVSPAFLRASFDHAFMSTLSEARFRRYQHQPLRLSHH